MTALLASVRDRREAAIAIAAGCDWLDLKAPEAGALGALAVDSVTEIVASYRGQIPISATIGDCWDIPQAIPFRVAQYARTGVDYLKLGLFVDRLNGALETAFRVALATFPRLIAVCFAEAMPTHDDVARLAALGFQGVMLDTADKSSGALPDHVRLDDLRQFVTVGQAARLVVGLAGGLRATDIAALLPLRADYLGFRGALCHRHDRSAGIDPNAMLTIRSLLSARPPAAPVKHEESRYGLA
ncbi:MAG: (5-formylfuran-3-yl)methyl phosphate synthase [Gammaproteobacteria bacterium]